MDEDDEFLDAWNELKDLGGIGEEIAMGDFMNVDDLVETCRFSTIYLIHMYSVLHNYL